MTVIVGSARIDERGKVSGGLSGDQTGREVSTQPFYVHSKGWYILRAKSAKHAIKIADNMLKACNNKNLGYNQADRLGVIKYGINSKIKTACDCSSLVRACIKEATNKDVGNFTTANEAYVLEQSGLFNKRIEYKNGTKLYDGDILVTKSQGHTVVVVTGYDRSDDDNDDIIKVAKEVIAGKWGNGDERRKALACAGYDYAKVQAAVNKLLKN